MNQTDVITRLQSMHRPRTERPSSCCVQCGIVWPCPTSRTLDDAEPAPAVVSPPTGRAAVLLWAADQIDTETRQAKADGVLEPDKFRPCRDASAQLRRLADEAQQQPDTETQPRRGDAVEAWLKTQRDAAADYPEAYQAADGLLDLYRLHADMGVPLGGHVCEARVVGDCECLEPAPVAQQPAAADDEETP